MASPLRQNLHKLVTPVKLSPLVFSKSDKKSPLQNNVHSARTPSPACSLEPRMPFRIQQSVQLRESVYLQVVRKLNWTTTVTSPNIECNQNVLIDKSTEESEVEDDDKLTVIDTPRKIALSKHGLSFKKRWKMLGKGSFGTVIQAKYKGEDVAVKVIPKNRFIKSLNSLKNEANAMKLCHKNIVRVLQVAAAEGEYGLVFMELCNGINLQSLITEPSFTINSFQRARYTLDVAFALEHCHNNGVLHLDVKPSNIVLCTPGDFCKLCDFGSSQSFNNRECLTMSSGMNTVMYTDPLILQGKLPSEKSDIYSLGISSWQLMAREAPYRGYTLDTIIYKVGCGELRPSKLLNSKKEDQKYIELYKHCWHQDPNERPSIREIIKKLKNIIFVTST